MKYDKKNPSVMYTDTDTKQRTHNTGKLGKRSLSAHPINLRQSEVSSPDTIIQFINRGKHK